MVVSAVVMLEIRPGRHSGIITLVMIWNGVAPMLWAASTTPSSSSRRLVSTRRAIVGTTVGTKATIVPLVVAAFPFVARLVETSLRELDEGVVEAAQSMGATPFQIITKVMIPECLPGLISSMTTALTTILGYSAMSGVIGGGGLGKIALSYGYYRYQTNIMIVCVVLLVLMVQVFQTVGTAWATRSDKRLRK